MRKKRVLVFGGSGFIGSHVSDVLSSSGYNVTIFDIKKSPYISGSQKMIIGDINNKENIDKAIENNDIVYNFAGISDIDECHKEPIKALKMNILGNAYIIESIIKHKIKRYLYASSAYVYSMSGTFYRICKQTSEQIIESYSKDNSFNYTILRFGSLYGSRSGKNNSINKIITSALKKKEIHYYGDGSETREFIHVNDAANLSITALEEKYKNQILMLTGKKSIKYIELLRMIKEMLDDKVKIEIHSKKSDTHYKITPYSFNPKFAKKLTINPHIDLGQGILSLISEIHKSLYPKKYY